MTTAATGPAMATATINDADGVMKFIIKSPDGTQAERQIDVFDAITLFSKAWRDNQADGVAYARALSDAVATLGFEPVTQRTNIAIRDAVYARAEELKKNELDSTTVG